MMSAVKSLPLNPDHPVMAGVSSGWVQGYAEPESRRNAKMAPVETDDGSRPIEAHGVHEGAGGTNARGQWRLQGVGD